MNIQTTIRRTAARIVHYIVIVMIVLVPFTPVSAETLKSCDTDFYSGNDILFYDACASACTTSANTESINYTDSADNSEAIFKYLISTKFKGLGDKPMNAIQAAGFLGNIYQESKYDSTAIQSGKAYDESKAMDGSVGGYAFGIIQWDGGRRVALLKFAKKNNVDWKGINAQLGYLKSELDGSEIRITKDNMFQTTTSVGEATTQVMKIFVRPGDPNESVRIKAAEDIYTKYKDLAPSDGSMTDGCSTSGQGNGDIVATAKSLAWSSRSSDKGSKHSALENTYAYTRALTSTGVSKLGDACSKGGNSCDAFVATVMRFSGVDKDFPCCGADAQNAYLAKHTEKYEMVKAGVSSTKEVQPGDILWRNGHIKIYIGDGREAAASHCQRTGEQSQLYITDGKYYAYRAIQ